MSATAAEVGTLVDLATYPITSPASAEFNALATDCRAQLDANGCCILPGFLTEDAVARCVVEAVYANNRAATAQALANGAARLPDVNQVLEARATPSNPFFAGPR